MKTYMTRLMGLLFLSTLCISLASCDDDEWGNDNEAQRNTFFFGFQDWGNLKNNVTYSVTQGNTVEIPVQFWCAGTRNFDAEAFYYVDSQLAYGTDYQIVDASGNALQPGGNGAFTMNWNLTAPDATNNHRVQNIYFKALNGSKGDVTVLTFNPNDKDEKGAVRISNSYTPNNLTSQYEVHAFTQNYKVKVTIK
ncbi:MAG: hypothetical protein IJM04_11695 [Prevotella sp.]|nr:hypothetical protein [Prevotella sp.]